jgi:spore germination protein GerM
MTKSRNIRKLRRRPDDDPSHLTLYFVRWNQDREAEALTRTHRTVNPNLGAEERLSLAIGNLLGGPNEQEHRYGYRTAIPQGTGLKECRPERHFAVIDLTEEFRQKAPLACLRARVWQVVYTATQLADVKLVTLRINGEIPNFIGNMILSSPLGRPPKWPTFK